MAIRNDVFILEVRSQVVFPSIRMGITIPEKVFIEMCDFCEKYDADHIGVVTVKGSAEGVDELYTVGTWCKVASHKSTTSKAGGQEETSVRLTVEGQQRFQVQSFTQTAPFRVATIQLLEESRAAEGSPEVKALATSVQDAVSELVKVTPQEGGGPGTLFKSFFGNGSGARRRWPASASTLADMVAAGFSESSVSECQEALEALDVSARLQLVLRLIQKFVQVQKLSEEISSKMTKRTEDELRETVLLRQLGELKREMRRLKGGKDKSAPSDGAPGEEEDDDLEDEDDEDEATVLRASLDKANMSEAAQKIAKRELKRLQNLQPAHPEYTGCRTYLETLAGLPWAQSSKDDLDLEVAHSILEKDHYGLDKVKRRILEFLAVQKLRDDMKGPILCLHGPPGVGKTSLGRSVAKALGRKFHRIALGGVRDEAELRGHRRTYIGSMPGSIMQAMSSLKVNNPVILLDEIDKLTRNSHFNPSGAMLELLDPEQNHAFKDHYLNTPFDLSKVLFLCTCNDLQAIDRPLLDRMEIIHLSGYTVEEKVHITTTHLLPKQRALHALQRREEASDAAQESLVDDLAAPVDNAEAAEARPAARSLPEEPLLIVKDAAIQDLVSKWTMESGVRSLERRLAQLCRWAALQLEGGAGQLQSQERMESEILAEEALRECGPDSNGRLTLDAHHLPHILGAEMFEPDLAEQLAVGVSMGLAVTTTGGHLLFVEATRSRGSGRLTITGQLGDVMRESVSTAMSLLRSKIYSAALAGTREEASGSQFVEELFRRAELSKDPAKDPFAGDDVHVHFPAGAIPKDGPSAGVATTLALASLLLNRPVRSDTAVTGEITLRGHVLPVGGIRDKVLAARRAGARHVLLPYGNQRHAKDDVPASALGGVELHYVKHVDDALAWAFADDVEALPAEPAGAPGGALAPTGAHGGAPAPVAPQYGFAPLRSRL